jgi:hypothetical protein
MRRILLPFRGDAADSWRNIAISADDESYNKLQAPQRNLWLDLLLEVSSDDCLEAEVALGPVIATGDRMCRSPAIGIRRFTVRTLTGDPTSATPWTPTRGSSVL